MEFVDLSREIFHRAPVHPSHPPVVITVWDDHDKKYKLGNTISSSKALSISFSDHAGTHIDAPVHFDPRPGAKSIDEVPLENFYTSAFCLDLSQVPLKHAITVQEMEQALKKSGQEIRPKDTVLIYMATNDRLYGNPRYIHDFPGLALESVHWLADKGIGMFGVEAVSPSPEGELNWRAHQICGERGITHMECLFNLDKLVGRGRFRFVGFPLRIRGGSGSPIRAVAIFE